jgi:hypothetical protein
VANESSGACKSEGGAPCGDDGSIVDLGNKSSPS